jgi:hypothetical protein
LFNFVQVCSFLPLAWFIVQMLRNSVVKCMYIDLKNLPFRIHLFYFILFYLFVLCVASDTQSMMSDETNLSADGQDSPPDMDSASGIPTYSSTVPCT